jgi:hypothetical protein
MQVLQRQRLSVECSLCLKVLVGVGYCYVLLWIYFWKCGRCLKTDWRSIFCVLLQTPTRATIQFVFWFYRCCQTLRWARPKFGYRNPAPQNREWVMTPHTACTPLP